MKKLRGIGIMSQDSVERFLGRLITDDDFRKAAIRSFYHVCFENGFQFSEDEKEILQTLNFQDYEMISKKIHKGIKRYCLSD